MQFRKCSIYGSFQNCAGFNLGIAFATKFLTEETDFHKLPSSKLRLTVIIDLI